MTTLNGETLDVPLEDCVDRLDVGEYGTFTVVVVDPGRLRPKHLVSVLPRDGVEGTVGTVMIRAAVVA